RVFEAMGLGKKLITTNPDIVNYDFYNPNNIFVWEESTNEIPEYFLNTPYEELPENIYRKYSQENWVKTIFGQQ
ncbi:MAG TPA: lipopolysaccharide core biosynthesis protein rfaS, partial [Flavobacterium sp.]